MDIDNIFRVEKKSNKTPSSVVIENREIIERRKKLAEEARKKQEREAAEEAARAIKNLAHRELLLKKSKENLGINVLKVRKRK